VGNAEDGEREEIEKEGGGTGGSDGIGNINKNRPWVTRACFFSYPLLGLSSVGKKELDIMFEWKGNHLRNRPCC
jgi:hypothetical protein